MQTCMVGVPYVLCMYTVLYTNNVTDVMFDVVGMVMCVPCVVTECFQVRVTLHGSFNVLHVIIFQVNISKHLHLTMLLVKY